jgi:uncharacterized protein YjlB
MNDRLPAATAHCEAFTLAPNQWVPNNSRLPVLLWRAALDPARAGGAAGTECAARFEALFGGNGWPAQWRDGIFDYHHFHSTAHEALGIAAGHADLIIGGPNGRVVRVEAGDALVLPAGTGHCLMSSGGRLLVVGGYPPGQQWDIRRDALSPDELRAMELLPFPSSDPVEGEGGALTELWR